MEVDSSSCSFSSNSLSFSSAAISNCTFPRCFCSSLTYFQLQPNSLFMEFLTLLESVLTKALQSPLIAINYMKLPQDVDRIWTQNLYLTYAIDFQKHEKELENFHPYSNSFAFCISQWRASMQNLSLEIWNEHQHEKDKVKQEDDKPEKEQLVQELRSTFVIQIREFGQKTRDLSLAWQLISKNAQKSINLTQEIVNWYEEELSLDSDAYFKKNWKSYAQCCGCESGDESDEQLNGNSKNNHKSDCTGFGSKRIFSMQTKNDLQTKFFAFLRHFQAEGKKLNEFPASWNLWLEIQKQEFPSERIKVEFWLNSNDYFPFSSFQWNLKFYLLLWESLQKKKKSQGKLHFLSNQNVHPFLSLKGEKSILNGLLLLLRVRSIEYFGKDYGTNTESLNPLTLSTWIKHWHVVELQSTMHGEKPISLEKKLKFFQNTLIQLSQMERKTVIRLDVPFSDKMKKKEKSDEQEQKISAFKSNANANTNGEAFDDTYLNIDSFEFFPFLFSLTQLQGFAAHSQWIRTPKKALGVLRRFVGMKIFDSLDLSQSVITGSALLPTCSSQLLAEKNIQDISKRFRPWVEEELYYPKAYTQFLLPETKVEMKIETEDEIQTFLQQKSIFSFNKARALANLEIILKGDRVRWFQDASTLVISSDVSTPNLRTKHTNETKKRQQIECKLTPGSDVDILVWNEKNFQLLAENHIRTIQSLCPQYQVKVERIDQSGALRKQEITEKEAKHRIKRYLLYDPEFHLRPIQIYCAPLHSIFSHHCAPVRSFCARNGKEREIFLTSSCLLSIWERKITQCDRFSGKKTPFEVLLWMKLRGFEIELSDSSAQICWDQNPFESQPETQKTKYCLEYVGFDVRQYFIASQIMKEYSKLKENQKQTQKRNETERKTKNCLRESKQVYNFQISGWRSLVEEKKKQKKSKKAILCCPFHSCLCATKDIRFDLNWVISQVEKEQTITQIPLQSLFRFVLLTNNNEINDSKKCYSNKLKQTKKTEKTEKAEKAEQSTRDEIWANPKLLLSKALSLKLSNK